MGSTQTNNPAIRSAGSGKPSMGVGFMHDTFYCGKRFRTLNVVDEETRECSAIEVDTSLPAGRVVLVLEQLKAERGLPTQL